MRKTILLLAALLAAAPALAQQSTRLPAQRLPPIKGPISVFGLSQNTDGITLTGEGALAQFTTGTGGKSDNKIAWGIVDGSYAWIMAIRPSFAFLPLVIQPRGGPVGIGTFTPGALLDVAGTMRGQVLSLSAAPTAATLPASYWTVVKRTDDGSMKICANDAGTIKCAVMTSNTEKFLTPGAAAYAVALTDPDILIIGGALTQDFIIDLPAGASTGRVIRFIRPSYAGGAFNVSIRVGGTIIKNLSAANQWTEFRTNSGGGWYLYGSGTL